MTDIFQQRLRTARQRRGWTQAVLADRCTVPCSQVTHYETGGRAPAYHNLLKLASELGVSLDWLCGLEAPDAHEPDDKLWAVEIRRVVDGDTLDVLISLGFAVSIAERVRVEGIDTPELRRGSKAHRAEGRRAKAYVESLLPPGSKTRMRSDGQLGKFGRIIGDFKVQGPAGDQWLAEVLVREGLAQKKEY